MQEYIVTPVRPRHKIFRKVYETILKDLKDGVIPWLAPWQTNMQPSLPINAISGRPYKGINIIILWIECANNRYNSNRWLTEKQIDKIPDASIKFGQYSTPVLYFGGNVNQKTVVKYHSVFNIDQVDNLPNALFTWQPIAKPEFILKNCGAIIKYKGQEAVYNSEKDNITLPPKRKFIHSEGYYSTAFHELIHWSGFEERLDRLNHYNNYRDRYIEELIAEIGSAFLCAETQVKGHLQHTGYIDYYFDLISKNWKMLLKAANKAQIAANFIIDSAIGRTGVEHCYKTGHIKDIKKIISMALGQYARYNNKVKIGVTSDPEKQWLNAKVENENWKKMLILYKTSSRNYALEGKKYLIDYLSRSAWSELPEYPVSIGNIAHSQRNYYIYALMR